MNNEILDKVDEIITYIKDTDEYKDYVLLKDKLESNSKVKSLIKEVKSLQQKLVKAEAYRKDSKELESNYNQKLSELDKIPLYTDYKNSVEKLNEMYQTIKNRLDDYFYNKLN